MKVRKTLNHLLEKLLKAVLEPSWLLVWFLLRVWLRGAVQKWGCS